ncbi:MAG: hypothetical protein K2X69_07910, partial [Silvanigrellaceae bacterium]|nr:hypothetical protein [Silvanigrellaceae bacterium]
MLKNNLVKITFLKFTIYQIISALIILLILFINSLIYKNINNERFHSGSGYIQHLSRFNYNDDILTRLIEYSVSIFQYEKENLNNISIEIWQCEECKKLNHPIWNRVDVEINEYNRIHKIDKIMNNEQFYIANKYLYIANVYKTKNNIFKVVFYKKLLDFFNLPLLETLIILNIVSLILIIITSSFLNIYKTKIKNKIEYEIKLNTINNIQSLIEHSLNNQLKVLKSKKDFESIINKSIIYNQEALSLLNDSNFKIINPEYLLKNNDTFKNFKLNISVSINIYNLIYYINKNFEHIFHVLIHNAIHDSVSAKNVYINIYQKKINSKILIDISNDGELIDKNIRNKIFKGFTTKQDGHGKGLPNLSQMLKKSHGNIELINCDKTTFRVTLPYSKDSIINLNTKFSIDYNIQKIDTVNEFISEDKPIVIIIEDEEIFWDEWEEKMIDAKVFFFKDPDDFIRNITKERKNNKKYLSNIDLIICDFNFGDYNLVESDFFEEIKRDNIDNFNGNIVISS